MELAWTTQPDTQSSGWRRERPGKLSVGMATTKSNESQFTRYSRLRYYIRRLSREEVRQSGRRNIVYGVNAVLEALRAGKRQIETITILESARPDRLKPLLDLAREKGRACSSCTSS